MKNRNLGYAGLYIFAFGALGAFSPLIGQYLKLIGFSGAQIGSITSAGTATAIFASPFWGGIYSRSGNKKAFILKLSLAAAMVCALMSFLNIYILFILFFCMLYFFQAPVMALVDAMTMEDGQLFGAARKWGAVGFALGVYFAGKVAEITGLHVIFFVYTGCFAVFAAVIGVMAAKGRDKKQDPILSREVMQKKFSLKNRKYITLIISAFFINGAMVAHNTYFGFLFVQSGGGIAGIGLAFLLMSGSEALFMALEDKLAKRFSLEKTLLAAMCLSAVRYAWYSTYPRPALLLGFFILQGMTIGITIIEFVKYVAKIAGNENLGSAIPVYYALGSSLSAILCQMAGGVILDYFNAGGVYLFFASMNLIGVIVYLAGKLYRGD